MELVYVATDSKGTAITIGATGEAPQHEAKSRTWYTGFRYLERWEMADAVRCAHFLQRSLLPLEVTRRGPERWFEASLDDVRVLLPEWTGEKQRHAAQSGRIEQVKKLRPMARTRTPDSSDARQCERLREVRRQMEALAFEKDRLELALKLRLEACEELEGLCQWTYRESRRVDVARLRAARPEIFEQFSTVSGTRYFRLL